MASGTGGIDLLSMYNDEEEDEDELMEETPATVLEPAPEPVDEVVDDGRRFDDAEGRAKDTPPGPAFESTSTPPFDSRSTPHSEEGDYDETLKIPVARSPTPPPFPRMQRSSPFTLVSTPPQGPSSAPIESWDPPGTRRGALSIVDYGHDDTAMSPEPEEEEIFGNGRVTVSAEVQASEVKLEERTPPGTVQVSTTNVQQSFQPTELSELPSETPMDFTGNEIEVSHFEETVVASAEVHKDDILTNFLRPPLSVKCSEELQEKINKFLAYKRAGKSFNADLRNRKDYRNPDFLQHAVRYQEIDEIGSCFSKDVFDPHGYDKSDYYDEIENEMRREIERKDMERKKSQRMEFVSGGTAIVQTSKLSTQNPVASISVAVNTSLSLVSTAGDALGKDARQNKKTKWDKVDSDVKNTIAGGQDNAPTTGLHAAILSASNAGAGYTAFAQQKRKEAEVKRTSDKRLDKRS